MERFFGQFRPEQFAPAAVDVSRSSLIAFV